MTSNEEAISVLGEGDKNIKALEKEFNVKIFYNQQNDTGSYVVNVVGPPSQVRKVYTRLLEMKESQVREKIQPKEYPDDAIYLTYSGKFIRPKTTNQKKYVEAMKNYDIVISIGPAGTGKTFLAVATALSFLEQKKITRIVLSRPVVEAGERLGFLPGDIQEKINPYLKPLYDAFYTMLGPQKFKRYKEEEIIEIVPLAYMRGRTIEDAFIILDEAQNTVPEQMKMFLTRLGVNSRAVITGDITQIDLRQKSRSGLVLSKEILKGIKGIKICYFNEKDVVRHRLVKNIIKAYESWEEKTKHDKD